MHVHKRQAYLYEESADGGLIVINLDSNDLKPTVEHSSQVASLEILYSYCY